MACEGGASGSEEGFEGLTQTFEIRKSGDPRVDANMQRLMSKLRPRRMHFRSGGIRVYDTGPDDTYYIQINAPTGLVANATFTLPAGGGTGVAGPASATDNAIARFDGTTGTLVQNSAWVVDDTPFALHPASDDAGSLGTTSFKVSDIFLAEGAVINWDGGDVTITQTGNVLSFAGAATRYEFDANVCPTTDDGAALGTTSLKFADLFLANGSVINWNSDVTLTHSTGTLTFADGEIVLGTGVLSTSTTPSYILGVDSGGKIVRVAVGNC